MKKIAFVALMICISTVLFAQKLTPEQYIDMYKDLAIREMKRMGVPASVTLAQGILETECGNSELVKKSNNHFGIKCKSTWTAEGVSHDDDAKGECFRTYKNSEDSYRDHSNFLRGNQRYGFLFQLDPADYKGWCLGLKQAGYATNPKYSQTLINTIEKYNLNQYTLAAIDQVAKFDATKYKSDEEKDIEKTDANEESQLSSMSVPDGAGTTQALINPAISKKSRSYFNGLKAVFAPKGTSLLAIATANDIALATLLAYNDMQEDGILNSDQWIFLEQKAKEGRRGFYVVQKGETLYDIAQGNGIQLQDLLSYNNLQATDVVAAGTKLKLKPSENTSMPENTTMRIVKKHTHIVQSKDSLYAIARKYNTSVDQIKQWNNLQSPDLKIGQEIIVTQ